MSEPMLGKRKARAQADPDVDEKRPKRPPDDGNDTPEEGMSTPTFMLDQLPAEVLAKICLVGEYPPRKVKQEFHVLRLVSRGIRCAFDLMLESFEPRPSSSFQTLLGKLNLPKRLADALSEKDLTFAIRSLTYMSYQLTVCRDQIKRLLTSVPNFEERYNVIKSLATDLNTFHSLPAAEHCVPLEERQHRDPLLEAFEIVSHVSYMFLNQILRSPLRTQRAHALIRTLSEGPVSFLDLSQDDSAYMLRLLAPIRDHPTFEAAVPVREPKHRQALGPFAQQQWVLSNLQMMRPALDATQCKPEVLDSLITAVDVCKRLLLSLTYAPIPRMLNSMRTLQKIDLRWCSSLPDEHLVAIVKQTPHIKMLWLPHRASQLTEAGVAEALCACGHGLSSLALPQTHCAGADHPLPTLTSLSTLALHKGAPDLPLPELLEKAGAIYPAPNPIYVFGDAAGEEEEVELGVQRGEQQQQQQQQQQPEAAAQAGGEGELSEAGPAEMDEGATVEPGSAAEPAGGQGGDDAQRAADAAGSGGGHGPGKAAEEDEGGGEGEEAKTAADRPQLARWTCDWTLIGQLTQLRTLAIDHVKMHDSDIAALMRLTNLRVLRIANGYLSSAQGAAGAGAAAGAGPPAGPGAGFAGADGGGGAGAAAVAVGGRRAAGQPHMPRVGPGLGGGEGEGLPDQVVAHPMPMQVQHLPFANANVQVNVNVNLRNLFAHPGPLQGPAAPQPAAAVPAQAPAVPMPAPAAGGRAALSQSQGQRSANGLAQPGGGEAAGSDAAASRAATRPAAADATSEPASSASGPQTAAASARAAADRQPPADAEGLAGTSSARAIQPGLSDGPAEATMQDSRPPPAREGERQHAAALSDLGGAAVATSAGTVVSAPLAAAAARSSDAGAGAARREARDAEQAGPSSAAAGSGAAGDGVTAASAARPPSAVRPAVGEGGGGRGEGGGPGPGGEAAAGLQQVAANLLNQEVAQAAAAAALPNAPGAAAAAGGIHVHLGQGAWGFQHAMNHVNRLLGHLPQAMAIPGGMDAVGAQPAPAGGFPLLVQGFGMVPQPPHLLHMGFDDHRMTSNMRQQGEGCTNLAAWLRVLAPSLMKLELNFSTSCRLRPQRLQRRSPCRHVPIDNHVLESLQHCTNLTHLCLGYCHNISDGPLAQMLGSLTKLTCLQVCGPQLRDPAFSTLTGLKKLRDLNLHGCQSVASDTVRSCSELPSLRRLSLRFCNGVRMDVAPYLAAMKEKGVAIDAAFTSAMHLVHQQPGQPAAAVAAALGVPPFRVEVPAGRFPPEGAGAAGNAGGPGGGDEEEEEPDMEDMNPAQLE